MTTTQIITWLAKLEQECRRVQVEIFMSAQKQEDQPDATPLFRLLEKSVENTKRKSNARKSKHSNANGKPGNG